MNTDTERENDGYTSKFNEAFLKIGRIDRLQDKINQCRLNPQAFNTEFGVFNYQIMFECIKGLMLEVWGKLDKKERIDIKALSDSLDKFLLDYPIHDLTSSTGSSKKDFKINEKNYLVFKKLIFRFESEVKELITSTGWDSPNLEDDYGGL